MDFLGYAQICAVLISLSELSHFSGRQCNAERGHVPGKWSKGKRYHSQVMFCFKNWPRKKLDNECPILNCDIPGHNQQGVLVQNPLLMSYFRSHRVIVPAENDRRRSEIVI